MNRISAMRERVSATPKWIRGRYIVGTLVLMFALMFLIRSCSVEPAEAMEASIVCPAAPAPFVLRQNVLAEVEGETVYLACAWVGGADPLP
jgi:hypothetical protein